MNKLFVKLITLDEKLSSRMALENPPKVLEAILKVVSHSCDSWYWMVGLVLLWTLSASPGKTIAVTTAFVTGSLAVFVLLVKFLIRRKRPEGDWGQIYRVNDPHSFPSGHAARAGAIVFLAIHFLDWWAILLVVGWAMVVAYSRVALKVHLFSDIVVGLVLGFFYAWGAIRAFEVLAALFPGIARILFNGF